MEDDEDAPPFWLRPGGSFRRSRSRGSSVAAIGSGALVLLLMAAALALVFIVVPSVLSAASQIFRPNVVKKSWDSLNLVLVLFAIFCGLLSRNAGGDETSNGESRSFNSRASPKSNQSMQRDQWLGYPDQVAYDRPSSFNRLRSSSSYPDLRQEPLWSQPDDRRRVFDDTHIYRSRSWRDEEEEVRKGNGVYGHGGTNEIKTIQVDRVEVNDKEVSVSRSPLTEPPSPPQPTPPPQQAPESSPPSRPSTSSAPPRSAKRKPKRTSATLVETHAPVHKPKEEYTKMIDTYKLPPPPPPPPVFDYYATPTKSDKNEKKRGGSATRDFIKSLGRKRKKQRQKSVENFETLLLGSSQPQSGLPRPSQPPPPPPPPPPPFGFHNLFSYKKGKSKPPPPPPAPPSRATKARSQDVTLQPRPKPTAAAGRPPVPANPICYTDSVDLGNRSPLIPIPPPPPPPFRVPDWKFPVRGGYVRIRSSSNASRGSSPDPMEDGQASPGGEISPSSLSAVSVGDVSEPGSPAIFCPSPDVDTKADNFIARFRAGLRMERMNSVQRRTRSNLGPDPNLVPES